MVRSLHDKLCIMWSILVDDDGHKRGQTSRPAVGAEIQTNCYSEAYIFLCGYILGSIFVPTSSFILDDRIALWYSSLGVPFCLVISIVSYTKIFHSLSRHQAQVKNQQQPSPPNALNIARYRKAVHSALWVQLALVVCYLPFVIVDIVISHSKTHSSHLTITREISFSLIYFNSTLNPFLYCWKISEVRQSVKQTIRQALYCSWMNSWMN